MNREDIIRVMNELIGPESEGWSVNEALLEEWLPFFQAIAAAGAAAERAACADICDQHASIEGVAQRCAAEIRARNK
jgi:hypothetical protein